MTTIQNILFPLDFSPSCDAMAPFVKRAAAMLSAKVTLLYVLEPSASGFELLTRPLAEAEADRKNVACAKLESYLSSEFPLHDIPRLLVVGEAAARIAKVARDRRFDLIVMPTHAGVFRRMLLGSTTAKVLNDADCMVLTTQHAETISPRPLEHREWVCALGLSADSARVLRIASQLAETVHVNLSAGNLGASNDESTWVLTSYLVSNAIVLPISGWFATVLGRKRFFMMCLVIFTLSSLLCGIAPSLGAMILFRVLQGAGGGGLQPMAQAILADTFPPRQRGVAFALYGITTIVAPTIGPTLGGWITDNYTWRWIFFINLPVGVMALILVYRLIEDPPWVKRLKGAGVKIDYIGVALLVLGVGALQVMLDKGQEDDWFGSHFILTLAVVAGVCLVSLTIWEWFNKTPIIDVRLYKNLNFLGANAMMFILGIMLFSSLVMMPQFLQTLMGYTAASAGLVLSGGGLLLLFLMPVVGMLTTKVQARYIIAFGWLMLSLSMYYTTQHLDLEMSFRTASMLRVVQVFGLGFLFVPINLASYVGMPTEKSNSIAGLVNFMRNIGSSIGTSMVTTLIARREQFHQVYLVAHTTLGKPTFTLAAKALAVRLAAAGLGASRASAQAYGRIYGALIGQATTLAYIDTFWVLAVGAGIMFMFSFALRKNEAGGGGEVAIG